MGEEGDLSLHCHHQNDSCIKMSSDESCLMFITSTETIRTIRDGEPTSTFTQLLSSEHTHFFFDVALRLQRPYRLLGTGAQDVHLDPNTAPELCNEFYVVLRPQKPRPDITVMADWA